MRKPNGQMSKKDRRACLAFGVVPSSDHQPVTMSIQMVEGFTSTFTSTLQMGTLIWNTQNRVLQMATAAQNLNQQMVTFNANWQITFDTK